MDLAQEHLRLRSLLLVGMAAILSADSGQAAVLRVCPQGCTYRLPSAAVAQAQSGDEVRLAAGTYVDCFVIPQTVRNLRVVGEPGAAMTGKICQQKALVVNSGLNTTLQGFELYGVSDQENVGGVRHQGTNLTMIGMHIHDNDDGILTNAHPVQPDYLLFDSCLFERNGWNNPSGMAHNMYIGHATLFVFRNSTSRATKKGGALPLIFAPATRGNGMC